MNAGVFARELGELVRLLRHEPGRADLVAEALRGATEAVARVTLQLAPADIRPTSPLLERCAIRGVQRVIVQGGAGADELLALARALASDEGLVSSTQRVRVTLGLVDGVTVVAPPEVDPLAPADPPLWPTLRLVDDRRRRVERRLAAPSRRPGRERRAGRERRQQGERRLRVKPSLQRERDTLRQRLEAALAGNAWLEALDLAAAAIVLMPNLPGDDRGTFRIGVRRLLTRPVLRSFLLLARAREERRARAAHVLHWVGLDGAEVMIEAIMSAEGGGGLGFLHDTVAAMPDAFPLLRPYLLTRVAGQAEAAARILGRMGLPEALPYLEQTLTFPDDQVRRAAAEAICELPLGEARQAIRTLLRHDEPPVRQAAVEAIGRLQLAPLAMPLVSALEEERDAAVAAAIVRALGQLPSPEAVKALVGITQARSRWFGGGVATARRVEAVQALGRSPAPGARAALQQVLRDGDGPVRAAARRLLSEGSQSA